MGRSLLDGNEAVARGAIAAGCRFFAGYPITPATTIFNTMLQLLPPAGGICMQGEDEIASIGFCLGASMAGQKVMTATSGPGISLYSENISFAVGSEIPIVIVDVQRLGPSTGSATRGADGDIQFLRWGNSGGLPLIVLAPMDVPDCFYLTMQAFNLAETFRCPVIVASNKEIGMTRESVAFDKIERPEIVERIPPPPHMPYRPFQACGDSRVPGFLPIGGRVPVRQTSSTHGPTGYITTDPREISDGLIRLDRKISASIHQFSFYESFGPDNAHTTVITYGITARAAKTALERSTAAGRSVSLLVLKTLWPVPEALVREKTRHAERVIVFEMNLGQYVREIQRILPEKRVEFFGRMDGRLVTPEQILEMVSNG